MIELDDLLDKIDDIIIEHGGVSYNEKRIWGDVMLLFKNGWRQDLYKMSLTGRGKNPRQNGDNDALGKRM